MRARLGTKHEVF